jgi:hypothetical protein
MAQTGTEKRADLFRVHLLRRRSLMTEVAPNPAKSTRAFERTERVSWR